MARYDHLPLVRLPQRLERRKRPGMGSAPQRNPTWTHSGKLRTELDSVVETRRRAIPEFVDPTLILRVRMNGTTMEEDWERLGLTLLASDDDKSLVLFSSDQEMSEFRARLDAYSRGTPAGQVAPSYAGFIGRIDEIGVVGPSDRIGMRLRQEGFEGN